MTRLIHLLSHQKLAIVASPKTLLRTRAQLIATGAEASSLLSLSSYPSTDHLHDDHALPWPLIIRSLGFDADPLKLFSFYRAVPSHLVVFDPYVHASLVKGCSKLRAIREGKSVHCRVIKLGLDCNVNLKNSLIGFYAGSGSLMGYARVLFDGMSQRTVATVNSMASGMVKNGSFDDGLDFFRRNLVGFWGSGLRPNHVTFVILVSGCVEFERFGVGKSLHCYCWKMGFGSVIEVCNVLIDLYSKLGCMTEALVLFEGMPERDLVSWNTMISGYASVGNGMRAFSLFREMRMMNVRSDKVSLISLILAAGNDRNIDMVKMVHGYIKACGREITLPIGTALINMYSKCGSVESAKKVFSEIQGENISPWNSMIHSYVECGHDNEAFELFKQMRSEKLKPDEVTMLGLVLACRNSRKLSRGIEIHSLIDSSCYLNESVVLRNALIDMYAKCGDMGRAKFVFDGMPKKDVVSWTSIIVGHAINGEGGEALIAFRRMEAEKVEPNSVTFLGVLYACDHAGLVEEGRNLYNSMSEIYGIKPEIEHCGSIVDMYSRSGRLEEAREFVQGMGVEPNAVIWRMLINACRVHGDFDTGLSLVGGGDTGLETSHGAEDRVVSSNFFAEAGRWDDVVNERSLMASCKAMKVAGLSTVSE